MLGCNCEQFSILTSLIYCLMSITGPLMPEQRIRARDMFQLTLRHRSGMSYFSLICDLIQ